MVEYILPTEELAPREARSETGLADESIMRNAGWFVTLRWMVVGSFAVAGLVSLIIQNELLRLGVRPPHRVLWILAIVLFVANIPLYLESRLFSDQTRRKRVLRNIWMQICLDLIVISVMVYEVGATSTFVSFSYLFHIVLSCIFFPPRESLLVTVIAILLFIGIILFESVELIPQSSLILDVDQRPEAVRVGFALMGPAIWIIVWYITSTLSKSVRLTDRQLSMANAQLIRADEEKNRQMLVTTHDLKAPFAGIESNIQVLQYQFWKDIPKEIQTIIERIDRRAKMLRERINAILVLGNLKSLPAEHLKDEDIDIKELIGKIVTTMAEKAEMKQVTLDVQIPKFTIRSDRDQLGILLSNLVSNAISYSRDEGTAFISASAINGGILVSIRDEGIGIREDALPHIFEDYYRTKEASRFNKQSTGLGLSIVKVIAQKLNLEISVRSELEKGTEFRILIDGK